MKSDKIEDLITMEIIVDAYGEYERSAAWYCYLEDHLNFPFTAKCRQEKRTNRLRKGNQFEVISMAKSEECDHDMYVLIEEEGDQLAVNLSQLTPTEDHNKETSNAIAAWQYWCDQGYQF